MTRQREELQRNAKKRKGEKDKRQKSVPHRRGKKKKELN